ncbi:cullin-4A [Martensiomyces pterosporus]|nr:cullin-4A [Martensiomyces pterosporus]
MWATKRPGPPSGGPQKKLVIKGLKSIPALPASFKADALARLQNAVRAIQEGKPTAQGLEELYRDCESLCLHNFGSDIYAELQRECERYTREQLSIINSQQDVSGEDSVLNAARGFWTNYTQQLSMIKCIFLYLDRTYVLQTANVVSLWAMGLGVVRRYLVDTDMKSRLTRLIVGEITRERDGREVDRAMLLTLVNMLMELSLYSQYFVPNLIESTREYYQRESRRLVGSLAAITASSAGQSSGQMNVPQYLAHVKRRLDEETQRISHYLSANSKAALLSTALSELVDKHTDKLLSTSFGVMVDGNMVGDLATLYSLLLPVNRIDTLKSHWSSYIKKTGLVLVQAPDLDVTLVTELLALKQRLDVVLRDAFQSNEALAHALRESFEEFINTKRNKPAQLIAKFVDQCMRSGSKMAVNDDLDDLLDRILVLFRFIQGKDLFEAFYKRDLAKRLLHSKSASTDAERSMLQRLKLECGAGFTNKLEGMFRDMESSENLAGKFAESKYSQEAGQIGFHANVLAQAFWPTYEPMDLVVPREVEQAQAQYASFYNENHHGRNLQWQHSLGTCLLRVSFDEGAKDLSLSLVQGTVLCLFSERDSLVYTEIQESTGLDDTELQRTLQSLACGKYRILTKEPKGRNVAPADRFTFNSKFSSPQARVKVNQIQLKEAEKENKETEEHIQLDRMYKVDAALVRIMKARKTIDYTSLMTELLGQLRFNTSTVELKKRIDSLIEREYMERDENDQTIYRYLA